MSERYDIACRIIKRYDVQLGLLKNVRRYVFFHANTENSYLKAQAELPILTETPEGQEAQRNLSANWEVIHSKYLSVIERVFALRPHGEEAEAYAQLDTRIGEAIKVMTDNDEPLETRPALRLVARNSRQTLRRL